MKHEESLQIAVCNYLRMQYPGVIFTSESSGVRLTMGQAIKAKKMRSGDKLPDLWILEPRNGYHGLLIELKTEWPYTKTGKPKYDHIAKQMEVIDRLNKKGYLCYMATGFDAAKVIIDSYFVDQE